MANFDFSPKNNLGESPDNPIMIEDVASHQSGVAKEYRLLEERFGTLGKDWKILMQFFISHNGRRLDRIDIQSENGTTQSFYFDVTNLFGLPQQTAEEQATEERHQRAQSNMDKLLKAMLAGGKDGFNSEFDRLFPSSENDDSTQEN